ncbi:MAG: hypothetical protein ACRD2B_15895 [Terriglobia bacterium]
MKHVRRVMSLGVALMAFMVVVSVTLALAVPPRESPLTGTWNCQAHGTSTGNTAFTLYLQQNGQNVTGSVSSSIGNGEIAAASFKNHKLSIEIDGGDTTYSLTATYSSGKLTGEWHSTNGDKGSWSGERSRQ